MTSPTPGPSVPSDAAMEAARVVMERWRWGFNLDDAVRERRALEHGDHVALRESFARALDAFAADATRGERERAAKVCEQVKQATHADPYFAGSTRAREWTYMMGIDDAANKCAAAIRSAPTTGETTNTGAATTARAQPDGAASCGAGETPEAAPTKPAPSATGGDEASGLSCIGCLTRVEDIQPMRLGAFAQARGWMRPVICKTCMNKHFVSGRWEKNDAPLEPAPGGEATGEPTK